MASFYLMPKGDIRLPPMPGSKPDPTIPGREQAQRDQALRDMSDRRAAESREARAKRVAAEKRPSLSPFRRLSRALEGKR